MSNKKIAPFIFNEKKARQTPLGKFVEDKKMPLLILKDIVLFPETSIAITSLSSSKLKEFSATYKSGATIAVVTGISDKPKKTDNSKEKSNSEPQHLSRYGTEAFIAGILKMKNGELAIILKGQRRFILNEVVTTKNKEIARVSIYQDTTTRTSGKTLSAMTKALKGLTTNVLQLNPHISQESSIILQTAEDPDLIANALCPYISL